jgi:hypothetical protein
MSETLQSCDRQKHETRYCVLLAIFAARLIWFPHFGLCPFSRASGHIVRVVEMPTRCFRSG